MNDNHLNDLLAEYELAEKTDMSEYIPSGSNKHKIALTKSKSVSISNKTEQNFKVVVRVRPPLAREIEGHAGFSTITQISKNCK